MSELWKLWHLLQWWGWLTWKHQTLSRNLKHVFHQVVLISQHILPLRILEVSVSKNPHCVRSCIGLLRGILLISPVVSTSDRSAKPEGENRHQSLGSVKSTSLNSLSCWEVSHPHFPVTSDSWFLASSTVLSALSCLSVNLPVLFPNSTTNPTLSVTEMQIFAMNKNRKKLTAHLVRSLNEMQLLVSCSVDKWPGIEAKAA